MNQYTLREEFGIFLLGWTGAVTITMALHYTGYPSDQSSIDLIQELGYIWAGWMLSGIAALAIGWAGIMTIVEVVNPMVDRVRRFMSWPK